MSWWIRVDDLVLPAQVGGHPALELCNTRSGWGEPYGPRQEYLRSLRHLAVLARVNEVLSKDRAAAVAERAETRPREADEVLRRTRILRADLRSVLVDGGSGAARRRVTRAVERARSRQVLVPDDGGFRWELGGRPRLEDPLDAFLVSAGDLLTTAPPVRVGACPGHDCGWLFVNNGGRRRWCQMAVCGNRAKQARWSKR